MCLALICAIVRSFFIMESHLSRARKIDWFKDEFLQPIYQSDSVFRFPCFVNSSLELKVYARWQLLDEAS